MLAFYFAACPTCLLACLFTFVSWLVCSLTMPELRQRVLGHALREGHGIFTNASLHPATAPQKMLVRVRAYARCACW